MATEKTTSTKQNGEELVTVELFSDGSEKYSQDVIVIVNGKSFQIQRGVPVQVPAYVKEVLDHSDAMDRLARTRMKKAQGKTGNRELN